MGAGAPSHNGNMGTDSNDDIDIYSVWDLFEKSMGISPQLDLKRNPPSCNGRERKKGLSPYINNHCEDIIDE